MFLTVFARHGIGNAQGGMTVNTRGWKQVETQAEPVPGALMARTRVRVA